MLGIIVAAQNYIAEYLRRDDRGATAVEYGLIVALIAAFIAAIVGTLGKAVEAAFQAVVTAL
jgi:pilus assembly protein Flp/PilA